uniref:Uncharacterized protein n=1 Tax=Knipowitschia caucasica TaxID=637954 RepID=A0AAV2LJT8_KNICA
MEFTTRFGLHSQTTRLREDLTPARREPLPASHRPRAEPLSEGLRPPIDTGQEVFRTPHFPRPPVGRGFGAGLFPLRSPLLRESCRIEVGVAPPESLSPKEEGDRGGGRTGARGRPVPATGPDRDRACFEHSNFFKVNASDPAGHSAKSIEGAPRGRGWDRRWLASRRTVSSIPRSNYELFNCSNFKIRYWSWNYRGCWHQTCPPMDPR